MDYQNTTSAPIFRDLFRDRVSNNPIGWTAIADLLDALARLVRGAVLPNLAATVRAAEEASAILFCVILTAKRNNIELGFQQLINEASGRSFGAKLINWAIGKMDADIADDLKVAWGSLHQQMSSTVEMLIRQLEPNIVPNGPPMTVEQVVDWIRRHGGIGKMHMEYMAYRRGEKQNEKVVKELDRQRGARERRLNEARQAGFDNIEAYDAHLLEVDKRQKELDLRAKFDDLKARLVSNGTLVADKPPENRLLISSGGRLYVISDEDEFSLLHCGARVL